MPGMDGLELLAEIKGRGVEKLLERNAPESVGTLLLSVGTHSGTASH
jgi:hypothetical protein